MALLHALPGEVISVGAPAVDPNAFGARTLFRTPQVEVIRLALPAGKSISEHQTAGGIIVQCLAGRVRFTTPEKTIELASGQMFYLLAAAPHKVDALEDCCFLLTILFPGKPAGHAGAEDA